MSVGIIGGNCRDLFMVAVPVTPTAVAANTTVEQNFTVPRLGLNSNVNVNKPSFQAGLGIVNARVSAANTLSITYANNTGASITPSSETYNVLIASPESGRLAAGIGF